MRPPIAVVIIELGVILFATSCSSGETQPNASDVQQPPASPDASAQPPAVINAPDVQQPPASPGASAQPPAVINAPDAQQPQVSPDAGAQPPAVVSATCTQAFAEDRACAQKAGRTYYVSASGSDQNDGASEEAPLKSLAKVAKLALSPGDRVLFKCGDVWRGELLTLGTSGAPCQHIVYGSYPPACTDQPRFSGSQPILGWTEESKGIWVANLGAGENAGKFPNGINQLFRGSERLPLGRWPNQDDPAFSHGYSRIQSQPSGNVIVDDALPKVDWTGAAVRYFSIRWLLLNRTVTQSSAGSLTLNAPITCYGGCGDPNPSSAADYGWGYVVTSHRETLDQAGEWFYDDKTRQVYVVSASKPQDMEGAVIPSEVVLPHDPTNDEGYHGLIELGPNLAAPLKYVVVENLRLENHWRHGIVSPINQKGGENSNIVIRCNTIRNVDSTGIRLATWVLGDTPKPDGWRGGSQITVANNVIDGPNHFGIYTFAYDSTFQDNLIKNVGTPQNLGKSGLGCGFTADNCTENGDGILFGWPDRKLTASSRLTVRHNRIERAAYCGLDAFGDQVMLEENVVQEACYTKGDCGAIRTYGARDAVIRKNVVLDVVAPIHGASSHYAEEFGFGLYIDAGSTALSEGNTIRNTKGYGILYQEPTTSGEVVGNTVFGARGRSMVFAGFGGTITKLTNNILVGTDATYAIFTEANGTLGISDQNYYIQPYTAAFTNVQLVPDAYSVRTLAAWQAASGKDQSSKGPWFSLAVGASAPMELFVNDTASERVIPLSKTYVDIDQKPVSGSIAVPPFSSRVLVAQ